MTLAYNIPVTMASEQQRPSFPPLKNDLLLRTARGETVERPPCWVMRQAGRYLPEYHEAKGKRDFFECCRDPEVASTLTLQPIERYEGLIDAAIIFSDILVIPQAMGMEVVMLDGKGPHFPNPLEDPQDPQYKEVMEKNVDVKESLDYVYKAITLTRQKLDGRVPLYGFCGAPFTLLCYMVEGGGSKIFKQMKSWIFKYPEESKKLLQKIAELCVEYLALQVVAGAQIVQVFDSWAGELSPASFKEFGLPYLKHICDNLPAKLRELGQQPVPMVVFAKGAWYALEELCKTNYNIVGLDWLHEPSEAYAVAQKYGKVLQGNADPGVLYGGHEAMTKVVENMVKGFGGGKQGWIANLGHGTYHLSLELSSILTRVQASHLSSSLTSLSSTSRRSTDYQVDDSARSIRTGEICQQCSSSINEVNTSCHFERCLYFRAENAPAQHHPQRLVILSIRHVIYPKIRVIKEYPHQCPRTYKFPLSKFIDTALATDESTYQSSGCLRMNSLISSSHSLLSTLITSTPRCLRYSSPPTKVLFSPSTMRLIL